MDSTMFVCELSKSNQEKIKSIVSDYLMREGYDDCTIQKSIKNIMEDRLWVVEEIIDIKPFLETGKVISLDKSKLQ